MENRAEKIEALKILVDFNGRLINNMKILVKELREEKLEDTDKLLNDVLNAINWEISIVRSTADLLNENTEKISKDKFNEKIIDLGEALQKKEDNKIAEAMEKLIIQFEVLGEVVRKILRAN